MLVCLSRGKIVIIRWRVQEIAKPERWTAKRLADESGLAYNTVWGIWNNRARRVDFGTLARLAATLKVSPNELFISDDVAECAQAGTNELADTRSEAAACLLRSAVLDSERKQQESREK
jgi:DNA-binding Xre family transcriptional regulator